MFNLNNLQITRSPLLIIMGLIISSCAFLILYNTALPMTLYILMSVAGLIITLHFIAKLGLLALPTSIVRCDSTEESLYLTQKNGLKVKVRPQSSTFMSPKLLILAWKPAELQSPGRLSSLRTRIAPANLMVITIDNISSQEDFRRLRVLLKFGKLNTALKSHR